MDGHEKQGNPLDALNSLYNKTQSVRLVWGVASQAEWLGPAVVIALGIIVFIMVMSTPGLSSEGSFGTTTQEQTIQNTVPSTCSKGDPVLCLQDFNIQAVGFENNKKFAQEVYDAFSIPYNQSPLYRQLWNKGGKKLILSYGKPADALVGEGSDCQGQAFPAADAPDGTSVDDTMNIWNWGKCGFAGGEAYLIIHETGHILAGRNLNTVWNMFSYDENKFGVWHGELKKLAESEPGCYKEGPGGPNYLKTYVGPGRTPRAESFAEGLADYVLYRSWQKWNPNTNLLNFPTDCRATYDWFKKNVFGVDVQPPVGSGL